MEIKRSKRKKTQYDKNKLSYWDNIIHDTETLSIKTKTEHNEHDRPNETDYGI